MGKVVRLADIRARRSQALSAGRTAADEATPRPAAFEAVEYGSGWYHGEAIRAARKPSVEPR